MAATVVLYVYAAQRLLPAAGHRLHPGRPSSSQDTSFDAMSRRRRSSVADIVRAGPRRRRGWPSTSAATPTTAGQPQRRAQPRSEGRRGQRRPDHRPAAAASSPGCWASTLFMQAAQDISVGGRAARAQYQYTLSDADLDELNAWAPRMLERLRSLPQLKDVSSDQQSARAALQPDHRPRRRRPLRHHAGRHRRGDLQPDRPAAGGAVLHPAERLPRGDGGAAGAAGRTPNLFNDLYLNSPRHRQTGAAVAPSSRSTPRHEPASRSATRASSRPPPSRSTWRPACRSATRPSGVERVRPAMNGARRACRARSRARRRRSSNRCRRSRC